MRRFEFRSAAARALRALRAHGGQLAYYAAVALALTAVALAADRYRGGGAPAPAAMTLPAAELASPARAEGEEAAQLRLPEGAQLLRGYREAPAWNEALGLWESHPARDFRLPDGAVLCLCAGRVRAVGASGAYGGFVEVESGELLLRYASIVPRADLKPGDALRQGDPLGTAGDSMPGEASLGRHLHLEALRGGAPLDPATLEGGD